MADASSRWQQFKASGARLALVEHLEHRMMELQGRMLNANRSTFEALKGRALEVKELLDELTK